MNRNYFIKILAEHGVGFLRSGSKHDIFRQNTTGKKFLFHGIQKLIIFL